MCARILYSKLSFLHRVCHDQNAFLSSQVFNSIAASDVTSMSLVKQYKFLESKLGAEFTCKVFSQPDLSLRDLQECVVKVDRMRTLEMSEYLCNLHSTLPRKMPHDGWRSGMLHSSIVWKAPGHHYLSSNCSAWLSLETETALLVTAFTMSSFLKHPHCANISCNVTQTCLLRLPLTTSQTVSLPLSLTVNGF